MDPNGLPVIDDLIQGTATKLRALSNLRSTPETEMASGVGIDYEKGRAGESGAD